MKTSFKSLAVFVVTIGISSMGAATTALAGGHGSHGGSGHGGSGASHRQGNRGSSSFGKHDSHRHDRDRYRGWGRYNSWYSPWSYGSSYCYPSYSSCYTPSYCYPSYSSCYTPSYCCESVPEFCAPQTCSEFCPPSYSEYSDSYSSFPGCYGEDCYRPWWNNGYDRYHDRDYRKDRDKFKEHKDFSKMSHNMHSGKGRMSGGHRGGSGIGSMGKMASNSGRMSGGSRGGRK
jgi:hypothetical protein